MSFLEFFGCVALISASAFMAASEIALFSLSRFQLRFLKDTLRPTYRKIKQLLSDPGGLLITILVLNEVFNITFTSLVSRFITRSRSEDSHWMVETFIGIGITTPIVLIFCEITPKVIAARINQLVAISTVGPLLIIYRIFTPLRATLKKLITLAMRLLRLEIRPTLAPTDDGILKESDFLLVLEEGQKEGAVQEKELGLIRNVFELDNMSVSEILTPLSQVFSLPSHTTIRSALTASRSQDHSRIPVTGQNKRDFVGVLYPKDLLRSKLQGEPQSATIAGFMRKPFFVSPTISVSALFRKFKQLKIHMAVVKRTSGETLGIVTMSDILDVLFEDLFTEEELEGNTKVSRPAKKTGKKGEK